MNFSQITKALEELSNISSNLQKIEWLKNHNDEDLKNIFKWYFDSSRITGIAEKKFEKEIGIVVGDWVDDTQKEFSDVIRYLDSYNTGTDEDIKIIQDYRDEICATDKER